MKETTYGTTRSRRTDRWRAAVGISMSSRPLAVLRIALPLLLDLLVPFVVYSVLHGLGAGDVLALTLSGFSTGVTTTINTVRRRRLDGVGLLVVIELALSVLLLFTTNDARFVLMKPSLYTAVTAVYLFATCVVGRPIVYVAATPLATKGDPLRAAAYEQAWERSAPFRRRERAITAAFGLALMVEAILRVIIVYHFTEQQVTQAFLLSQAPGLVLLVAVLGFTRLQVPALQRLVDAEQAALATAD